MNRKERRAKTKRAGKQIGGGPGQIPALLAAAVQAYEAGRPVEAERLCRHIVARVPDHPDALHLLGVIALNRGHGSEAISHLERAVRTSPRNADLQTHLGIAHMAAGRSEDAIACFQAALKIRSDHGIARFQLGLAFSRAGDLPKAAEHLGVAVQVMPKNPDAHMNLGIALVESGDSEAGCRHLRRAAGLAPGNPMYRACLASKLLDLGETESALGEIDAGLRTHPGAAHLHFERGRALEQMGRQSRAIAAYEQAIDREETFGAARNNLALILRLRGALEEAENHLLQAIKIHPRDPSFRLNLGDVLLDAGRFDEALAVFQELEREWPDLAEGYIRHATALQTIGRFDAARSVIERLERIDPDPVLRFSVMAADRSLEIPEADLQRIREAVEAGEMAGPDHARLCFAMGQVLEREKRFDEAFSYLVRGNAARNADYKYGTYDADAIGAETDRVIATFDADFFAQRKGYGQDDERPLFILGMMRSGTSLIEQILGAHRDVGSAGELRDFRILAEELDEIPGLSRGYPEGAADLTPAQTGELAGRYIDKLAHRFPEARRFTDKMPNNFLRIGLIALLLPRARVIHCRRNPMATCWSIFNESFSGHHPYAYDLDNIAHFYGEYRRLMAHWTELQPVPILDVDYEDLVTDQEGMTGRILEFCGLDWDDGCLRFFESQRTVRTVSRWQVRQSVYTSSMERWRPFEAHLAPLKNALHRLGINPTGEDRRR